MERRVFLLRVVSKLDIVLYKYCVLIYRMGYEVGFLGSFLEWLGIVLIDYCIFC